MKTVRPLLVALTLISLLAAACSSATVPPPTTPKPDKPVAAGLDPWQVEWTKATAAARDEGKLMIYCDPSGTLMRDIGNAFKSKFGIELDFVAGKGSELAKRADMERQAGINEVDIIISGSGTLVGTMKPMGLLGKTEPLLLLPEVKDPSAWITGAVPFMDKDHTAINMIATYQRYIFMNTDMVKEGEMTSYKDLLNPKWKGKIVLDDPTVSGTAAGLIGILAVNVWNVDETKDFLRQLAKQEPVIIRDKRLQGEWVAKGKYPIGIGIDREVAADFIRVGAPVAFAKVKEGTMLGVAGGGLGVLANRPHPEATRVFVNWILSKDGHALFVKGYGSPGTRADAPREGLPATMFPDPGEKAYPETEDLVLTRTKLLPISKEILADLLK